MTDGEHNVRIDPLRCGHQHSTETPDVAIRVVGVRRSIVVLDVQPAEVTHVVLWVELCTTDTSHGGRHPELQGIGCVDVGILVIGGAPSRVNLQLRSACIVEIRLDLGVNTTCVGITRRHIVDHVNKPVVGMAHTQRLKKRICFAGVSPVFADCVISPGKATAAHLVGDKSKDRTAILSGKLVLPALLKNESLVVVFKKTVGQVRSCLRGREGGDGLGISVETRLSNNLVRPVGELITMTLDPVEPDLLLESLDDISHLLLSGSGEEKVVHSETRRMNSLMEELHFAQSRVEDYLISNRGAAISAACVKGNCRPCLLRRQPRTFKHYV